jgi:hypothetical protein
MQSRTVAVRMVRSIGSPFLWRPIVEVTVFR